MPDEHYCEYQNMIVEDDTLTVFDKWGEASMSHWVTFCPFCGKKLRDAEKVKEYE